jgi:hypothetical protein
MRTMSDLRTPYGFRYYRLDTCFLYVLLTSSQAHEQFQRQHFSRCERRRIMGLYQVGRR